MGVDERESSPSSSFHTKQIKIELIEKVKQINDSNKCLFNGHLIVSPSFKETEYETIQHVLP